MATGKERWGRADGSRLDFDLLGRLRVFFFFSNRLGCLGSLLVSLLLTLVVIALLRR